MLSQVLCFEAILCRDYDVTLYALQLLHFEKANKEIEGYKKSNVTLENNTIERNLILLLIPCVF